MKQSKGFTLIELLVAIIIISVITVTLFYTNDLSIKLLLKARKNVNSMQTTRYVVSRISRDILNSSGAQVGSNQTKIVLNDITYEFMNNKIKRSERKDSFYMTSEGEIISLKFIYPSNKFVHIEIVPKNGERQTLSVYARN